MIEAKSAHCRAFSHPELYPKDFRSVSDTGNCVILRDFAILTIFRFVVNTLTAAAFGRIRAKSRSVHSGFDPRMRCRFLSTRTIESIGVGGKQVETPATNPRFFD